MRKVTYYTPGLFTKNKNSLAQQGFETVNNIEEADIVIIDSLMSWLSPKYLVSHSCDVPIFSKNGKEYFESYSFIEESDDETRQDITISILKNKPTVCLGTAAGILWSMAGGVVFSDTDRFDRLQDINPKFNMIQTLQWETRKDLKPKVLSLIKLENTHSLKMKFPVDHSLQPLGVSQMSSRRAYVNSNGVNINERLVDKNKHQDWTYDVDVFLWYPTATCKCLGFYTDILEANQKSIARIIRDQFKLDDEEKKESA